MRPEDGPASSFLEVMINIKQISLSFSADQTESHVESFIEIWPHKCGNILWRFKHLVQCRHNLLSQRLGGRISHGRTRDPRVGNIALFK